MKIAMRECDITPIRPCWQGGYVQREKYFEKVHDPIKASVFVLSFTNKKMVWISMDVSGVQEALAEKIINRVHELGVELAHEDVLFGATHTHSGPLVGSYNDREIDLEYLDKLVDNVSTTIVELYKEEGIEANIRYSSLLVDGLYSNRNDKNKLSDKWIHLLGFFEKDKMVALYCTLAHHCTVLGPNFMELSADLFGEIRKLLEEKFNVPVLMAQGNAGDMGNKQYRTSNLFDEVKRQAQNIVDQINKKMSPWKPLYTEKCNYRYGEYTAIYDVDVQQFIDKKAQFEKQLESEQNFDTIKLLVTGINSFNRKIAQGSRHVERKMGYRIYDMDDLQIVAVPGELGSILGLRIKVASKAKVCILWGYVNPCDLGYMIEKEAYSGFSQESNVTDYPAGIADAYAESIIRDLQK